MSINGSQLDRILAHVPLEHRAEVREFASLEVEEQLVRLYVKNIETREMAKRTGGWPAIANACFTTVAIIGAALYALTGGKFD